MNFAAIGEIDTLLLASGTIDRLVDFEPRPGRPSEKWILLRAPRERQYAYVDDAPAEPTEAMGKWPEMQRALEEIRFIVQTKALQGREPEFGNMALTMLPAGEIIPWQLDRSAYAQTHTKIVVPIATNALVYTFRGTEGMHLPVGGVWILNDREHQSEVNFGPLRRIQIELDVAGPREAA